KIASSDVFVFLDDVQYKKREFQNRNKIRTKDGFIWLTVPVITKGKYFQKINEVEIDTTSNWQAEHWKSIELNYKGTQFFEMYAPEIKRFYEKNWRWLKDLNVETVSVILEILGIKKKILFSSEMNLSSSKTERIIDICKYLKADTYLSGSGAGDYLEENRFAESGIKLLYQEYKHPVYKQKFQGFEPCLSAVDLIFNEGPRASEIIQ
ncbi:MAG: WbqC family protein, partial [Elusimicrobiota bacterium]